MTPPRVLEVCKAMGISSDSRTAKIALMLSMLWEDDADCPTMAKELIQAADVLCIFKSDLLRELNKES